jgi:hypothetical protein
LRRTILLGLCDKDHKRDKQLGHGSFSFSYRADGKIFQNLKGTDSDDGEDYGPTFGQKDVIGCGILLNKREIFFTKNGANIGTAFRDVELPPEGFYPAITIQSMSHHIESNFGTKKFVFDMEGYCQQSSLDSFYDICATQFDRAKLHSLVKSYLVHYAYVETLQAYEDDMQDKTKNKPDKNDEQMDQ